MTPREARQQLDKTRRELNDVTDRIDEALDRINRRLDKVATLRHYLLAALICIIAVSAFVAGVRVFYAQ